MKLCCIAWVILTRQRLTTPSPVLHSSCPLFHVVFWLMGVHHSIFEKDNLVFYIKRTWGLPSPDLIYRLNSLAPGWQNTCCNQSATNVQTLWHDNIQQLINFGYRIIMVKDGLKLLLKKSTSWLLLEVLRIKIVLLALAQNWKPNVLNCWNLQNNSSRAWELPGIERNTICHQKQK